MSSLCVLGWIVGWGLISPAWSADEPASSSSGFEGFRLERVFKDLYRSARMGIALMDIETGEVVFDELAHRPLVPASTAKLLVTAVALRELGPAYRFETALLALSPPDGSGRLPGDLYVRGSGDPTLVVEGLWKLVRDLKSAGVESVGGQVLFDDSVMESGDWVPGWDRAQDLERGPPYFASLGGLTLNHNAVEIVVAPGPGSGQPARVRLTTEAEDYLTLTNRVTTETGSSGRSSVSIVREEKQGQLHFDVRGTIPEGHAPRWFYRSVIDPTAHFAAAFAGLAQAEGLRVEGGYGRGQTPEGAEVLVARSSPPLSVVLLEMNKHSLNLHAEQVLRTVGAHVSGGVGTTEAGLEVIESYLEELGVPEQEWTLVNGSGLSREASFSPYLLACVIRDMVRHPSVGSEFQASLAIAGLDGTLRKRHTDEPVTMRGKTGSLDGVQALAGLVRDGAGQPYAFAFLVNAHEGTPGLPRQAQDRFVQWVFSQHTFKQKPGSVEEKNENRVD